MSKSSSEESKGDSNNPPGPKPAVATEQATQPTAAAAAAAAAAPGLGDSLPLQHRLGLSSDQQQLLLALQQRGQMDPHALLRLQTNSMERDALLGNPAAGASALGGLQGGGGDNNDRMLLQLLERQRQQQQLQNPSFDVNLQHELQRQALARELAERDYERALLQRLHGIPGAGGLGYHPGLYGDPLGRGLDHTRLALLGAGAYGGQLPAASFLQGMSGLPGGGGLGGPGLGRGPPTSVAFDDSITLEARSKQAFPLKLYRMLERAEQNGQDNIISFIDDGKAFAIHKPRAFETDIMPSYFNSHRMSSFQRQLNIYGFERINDGIQKGAYRHKYFVKGKKELLEKIKRPQKLRHGAPAEEDEEVAQNMAAEHLVGLSRTPDKDGDSVSESKDKNDAKEEKEEEEAATSEEDDEDNED